MIRFGAIRLSLAALVLVVVAGGKALAVERYFGPAYEDWPLAGPDKAKGAVIFNHGKSSGHDPKGGVPAYLQAVRAAGWDVFKLVRPVTEDNVNDSSEALIEAAKDLHAKGYGRVATVGQSFGGWISFVAGGREANLFHAIVATAPAAYGHSGQTAGRIGDVNWRDNARIVGLAGELRPTRVMAFFFANDPFDPGGRGEAMQAVLADRNFLYAVIDSPPGYSGHGAASGPRFAGEFGPCIAAFLDAPAGSGSFACPAGE